MRINIQRTVFQNFGSDQKTFGYRMFDDYSQCYNNCLEEEQLKLSDEEFVKVVKDNADDVANGMFNYLTESENGIEIDDNYYDWEWIKKALNL